MRTILILAILFISLLASPLGAHHKDGHNKGPQPSLDASFQVTPSSPTAFDSMFIEGFDFEPGELVQVIIGEVFLTVWGRFIPDTNGYFSFTTKTRHPGTYQICGYVDFFDRKGNIKKPRKSTPCGMTFSGDLVAFLEFQVVP